MDMDESQSELMAQL